MIRIIGGQFKGRRLLVPRDESVTRPVPARVKQSLFNLLRGHTDGGVFVDLFSGTGAFGLEALSRGAESCLFVERDKRIADLVRRNIENLGVKDRATLIVGDALGRSIVSRCPGRVDVVYMDPPYALVRQEDGLRRVREQAARVGARLADDGYLLLRTPWPLYHAREGGAGGTAFEDEDGESWVELDEDGWDRPPAAEQERPADADLRIDGLEGPETHGYTRMAVHWYMRTPNDRNAGPGGE